MKQQHWIIEDANRIIKSSTKEDENDLHPDRLLKSPAQKRQKDDFQKTIDDSKQKKQDLDKKFVDNWKGDKWTFK